jgi:hypothetical protein
MGTGQSTDVLPGQAGQPAQPLGQQPAATPAAPATPEQPGQSGQSQFVTRPEAEQIAQAAADKVARQSQAANDRLQTRVSERLAQYEKAGIKNVTSEQVQVMIQAEDAAQTPQAGLAQQPAAQPGGEVNQPNDPVVRKATSLVEEAVKAGIDLQPTDPIWKEYIEKPTEDPEEFLNNVREAIKVKGERMAAAGNPARLPALSTGGSTNTPAHAGLNATDTLNLYYDQKFPRP